MAIIWTYDWIGWWCLVPTGIVSVWLAINTLELPFIVWGLISLDVWITLFVLAGHMAGKNWFLDRMALLYHDMTDDPRPRRRHSRSRTGASLPPTSAAPTRSRR